MAPTRQRFIDRSRILAAISGATIITEAGSRSGALRTADEASQLGRTVCAVPGPVTSAASAGSNVLIQNDTARLICSGFDVARMIDGKTSAPERNGIRSGAQPAVTPSARTL